MRTEGNRLNGPLPGNVPERRRGKLRHGREKSWRGWFARSAGVDMSVLVFLLGVYGVVATRVEGVAAGDAEDAFPESDGEREAAQTFEGVGGAGGVEATTGGGAKQVFLQGRDHPVGFYEQGERPCEDCIQLL